MLITRKETLKQYTVTPDGMISSPGKFEGQPIYTPYLYECYLDGLHDEDSGDEILFIINENDFDEYPELADIAEVRMKVDEQGFVSVTTTPFVEVNKTR